ncbi:beta-galactosidase [Naumannella huperziae]
MMKRIVAIVVSVLCAVVALPQLASAEPVLPPVVDGRTVSYDGDSMIIDGKREYIYAAEYHYFRDPSPGVWRDKLEKVRAGGYNAVSLYVAWNQVSARAGEFDWSGVRDLGAVIDYAGELGLFVIVRPGPFIGAETSAGGLPGWIKASEDPGRGATRTMLDAGREYLASVDEIIAPRQWQFGGPVIGYQVDNEYCRDNLQREPDRAYMAAMVDQVTEDGITVPLTANNCGTWDDLVDISGKDTYPIGWDCKAPQGRVPDLFEDFWDYKPGTPRYMVEYQGGMFDYWGGGGYANCTERYVDGKAEIALRNVALASGYTMQGIYMAVGGTNWGWSASPPLYTSYDYGAGVPEDRVLPAKYYESKARAYFMSTFEPLRRTDAAPAPAVTDADVRVEARRNPETGTQFNFVHHRGDWNARADRSVRVTVPTRTGERTIPAEGTPELRVGPRESRTVLTDYIFGSGDGGNPGAELAYTTSDLMVDAPGRGRGRLGVLYGTKGDAGQTVLRYRGTRQPKVSVDGGEVSTTWDRATGELRLDYRHDGVATVTIDGGGYRDLTLVIADSERAQRFWVLPADDGPLVIEGPDLVRSATLSAGRLTLTGDTTGAGRTVTAHGRAANATAITWNGDGIRAGAELPAPAELTLPELTDWRRSPVDPQTAPGFDDSGWVRADRTTTNYQVVPQTPVSLYADDYGFHTGDIFYRGRFSTDRIPTRLDLTAHFSSDGSGGDYSVWLNGVFLGSHGTTGQQNAVEKSFAIPAGTVRPNRPNVLAIQLQGQGQYQLTIPGRWKVPIGISKVALSGRSGALNPAIDWRLQGNAGGEDHADRTRGPLNNGGLWGEQQGWGLPGFDDSAWRPAQVPNDDQRTPGVTWYRTTATLDVPDGLDASIGLTITEPGAGVHRRALIFVNGWQLGRYVADTGPQRTFPIPRGILDENGENTIAIASWNTDATTGGIGEVSFTELGRANSPLEVPLVDSPGR